MRRVCVCSDYMQMCYKIVFEAFSAKAREHKRKKEKEQRQTRHKEERRQKEEKKEEKKREKNERKLVHKISLLFNLLSSR